MKLDALKWGGALLLMLGLMAGSDWAAWAWQANAYGQQLAELETAHQADHPGHYWQLRGIPSAC